MKYSELSDNKKNIVREEINKRSAQLLNAAVIGQDNAIKYIFLTNSGGAIASLSFIGAAPGIRENILIWLMLGSFSLGIILVGILHIMRLYLFNGFFGAHNTDASNFFKGKCELEDLQKYDIDRTDNSILEKYVYISGHASFACFLLGIIFGFIFVICR